jgi:two-component system sensor histidine kinase KdpD
MLERVAVEAESARRGKLKIFFGMAPGVGKTFALLQAAHEQRRAGVDVVLGWVETHGRRETEVLVVGSNASRRVASTTAGSSCSSSTSTPRSRAVRR